MNSSKNGATARTVNPTQQPGRPAKQNQFTLFPLSSQAIPADTTLTGCTKPPAALNAPPVAAFKWEVR